MCCCEERAEFSPGAPWATTESPSKRVHIVEILSLSTSPTQRLALHHFNATVGPCARPRCELPPSRRWLLLSANAHGDNTTPRAALRRHHDVASHDAADGGAEV